MAIRLAVVGLGRRGQEWLREVRGAPGFELVACVDSDPEALRRLPAGLANGAARHFTDLDEALGRQRCDAVIVATAPASHVEPCERALTRGVAVMVEKPFTLHLREAAALVALADRTGARLLVAQNYRYMRAFRTARRLIQAGALGRIGMVIGHYYRVPHAMAASLSSLPDSVLWGAAIHHLDVLRHILRLPVTRVFADSFTLPWGTLPAGGSLQMMLTFADATRAQYSASYESSGHEFFEEGQEFYLRFVGERATLHVCHRWLVLCEAGRLPRPVRRGGRAVTEERILLDQFARALAGGEEPESSGRDNLQTMAIVEACRRSAAAQVWVNPQELLHEYR